jgi:acyl-CoA reductase-like NAD-dependent aldehyde dehydrogenase
MNRELGGKTAMIMFDDARLASTPLLAARVTTFAGQNCMLVRDRQGS